MCDCCLVGVAELPRLRDGWLIALPADPISDDQSDDHSAAHSAAHSASRSTSRRQTADFRAQAASVEASAISGSTALDEQQPQSAGRLRMPPAHSLTD